LSIGGITIENGKKPKLAELQKSFDAVFVGVGLAGVNDLGIKNDDVDGIKDAVGYIADLRQARDLSKLPVGRKVVVIGGGMTAIDCAVQSKLLGAEDVTILYRRGADQMKASKFEQDLAQTKGVKIKHWVAPKKVIVKGSKAVGLMCDYMEMKKGKLVATGETFDIAADMIFRAIGQTYVDTTSGALKLANGRIAVDTEKRTSARGVWAGGDCAAGGKDLTVAAVDDGRRAAESIHAYLAA
jgi:dihydropyrimidine dehydrogenase (NAD+) subunit PreT